MDRIKRNLTAAVAMLLCVCAILGMALTVGATDTTDLNYGMAGSESNLTLSHSELLALLYPGIEQSEAERLYADERLLSLTYNSNIPQEKVRTLYHKESGVLDITATPYSYVAENGSRVEWTPKNVTIDGRTLSFSKSGDVYVCNYDGLHYADDFEMVVNFSWSVVLDASVTEMLLLRAGEDGARISEDLARYEREMKQYLDDMAAHEAFVAFERDKKAHDDYTAAYSTYLIKRAEYEAYVEEQAKYDAEAAAFAQYQIDAAIYQLAWDKYQTYSDFMEKYGQDYAEYLAYSRQMDRIAEKLSVMEMMIVRDSNGWSLYRDIQGKTVSTVLENKDRLTQIGYTRADDAAEATEALRVLLKGYVSLRATAYPTIYAKNKALYTYYQEHYEAIKANFIKLYEALYNLYGNGVIIDTLEKENKGAHFRQFLASLYIARCCLDDTMVMSMDWTPGKNFKNTLSYWVEPLHMISDNVQAAPGTVTYPEREVKKIVPPEAVDYPGDAPDRVDPPSIEDPDDMDEPEEPEFVADPGDPPPFVEKPTNMPVAPTYSDAERAWSEQYTAIDYDARRALLGERTLELSATLCRAVSVDNSFKVTFYSHDGKTVCFEQVLRYGDSADMIDYSFRPVRENTAQYTYEFIAWTLFSGEVWKGEQIESDLSFIPKYRSHLCEYTVVWIIDGVPLTQRYTYGSTPVYPYVLEKAPTEEFTYAFSGWDREIATVTGDATYTGFYSATRITYTVTWKFGNGKEVVQVYGAKELPSLDAELNYATATHFYTFKHWNRNVVPVTSDVTYIASYQATPFSMDAYGVLTEVEQNEKSLVVSLKSPAVYFSTLSQYALDVEKDLILQSGDVGVLISVDALRLLQNAGCTRIALEQSELERGTSYRVCIYDLFGNLLTPECLTVTVLAYYTAGTGSVPVAYRAEADGWSVLSCTRSGGVMRAEHLVAEAFLIRSEYSLQYASVANCNILSLPAYAPAGSWVDLAAKCTYGYEIVGATVTCSDGSVIEVVGKGFTMPESAASVQIKVEKIVYRVSFVVNGEVVSYREYGLGEEIVLPSSPTMDPGDGYVYTFAGWSPEATLAIGDERDLIFEAKFLKGILNDNAEQQKLVDNAITKRLILYGVLAFLLPVSLVLSIVFRKRIKKFIVRTVRRIRRQPLEEMKEESSELASDVEQSTEDECDAATEESEPSNGGSDLNE